MGSVTNPKTLDSCDNGDRLKLPTKREANMARPVKKETLKAYELLSTPHPRSPSGQPYTMAEAAREAGITLSTMYYHVNKQKQAAK